MKLIESGKENCKSLLFIPCEFFPSSLYQKSIDALAEEWHIYQIDFDFQKDRFTSMKEIVNQVLKILSGISCFDFAYGCSFGGRLLNKLKEEGICFEKSLSDVFCYYPKLFSALYVRQMFKKKAEFERRFPSTRFKGMENEFQKLNSVPKETIQSILRFLKHSERESILEGKSLKYLTDRSKSRISSSFQLVYDTYPFELLFSKPEELSQRIEVIYEIC